MKNLLVGLLAIFLTGLVIQAQVSSPVEGKTVEDSDHGYSFTAPANWSVEKSPGKDAGVILTNQAETIIIVVKPHHSNSLANFFKNESNLPGQGFMQSGEVKELANNMKYVRVVKSTDVANFLLDIIFVPISSEGGVVVINFTPTGSLAEEAMRNAVSIVKSFRFSTPQTSGQSQQNYPSPSSTQNSVSSIFTSKKLYAEGRSSQTEIILCPSGRYTRTDNFFYSSGSSTDEESGTWLLQSSGDSYYLVLNSRAGEQKIFQVSVQSQNSVTLDNRKYFMENYGCR